MKVSDLLKSKSQTVITATPDETVVEAMRKLVDHKIGSLVVCSSSKILGIISERDVLRAAYEDYEGLRSKKVSDLMSTNLIVAIPDDEVDYIMGIMTQNRIRHLPIVTKEGIVGIVLDRGYCQVSTSGNQGQKPLPGGVCVRAAFVITGLGNESFLTRFLVFWGRGRINIRPLRFSSGFLNHRSDPDFDPDIDTETDMDTVPMISGFIFLLGN